MKSGVEQIQTFYIGFRLKDQIADETTKYHQEIANKQTMIRECESKMQRQSLDKLQMERELERQKFIEIKQLQQYL